MTIQFEMANSPPQLVFPYYRIRWIFGGNLIWRINLFWMIGRFYIGKRYCILHALSNKIENLVVLDFRNSPNHQNKFYTKFSSYTVL